MGVVATLSMLMTLATTPAVIQPAEWAPQESVWLSWPTYEHRAGVPVWPIHLDIIRALQGRVKVDLLVRDFEEEAEAMARIAEAGLQVSNVRFHRSPNQEIWIRDFGPTFVRQNGRRAVATFRFDYWGYATPDDPDAKLEDAVDDFVAKSMGLPVLASRLVSEGGNRDTNGQGVYLMVEAVENRRNPGLTRAQREAEYRRVLGARQIIWLEQGPMEDDLTFEGPLPNGAYTCITTGGHVDNAARWVSEDTVLLAWVDANEVGRDPVLRETRRRMVRNEEILRRARLPDGRPIRIIRAPSPDPMFTELRPGDPTYDFIAELEYARPFPKGRPVRVQHAASYLNFLISNGVIVTSRFWKPGRPESTRRKDQEMERLLRQAFPDRTIVALDTDNLNIGGGGIHCITQQMPR